MGDTTNGLEETYRIIFNNILDPRAVGEWHVLVNNFVICWDICKMMTHHDNHDQGHGILQH